MQPKNNKYVTQELFETTNKTIFEKFREHDQHLVRIEGSISSMRSDVANGFQQLTTAISGHKESDLKSRTSNVFLFFGAFATLFGFVVYFGEMQEEIIDQKILSHKKATDMQKELIEEKIKNVKLESSMDIIKKN